MGDFIKMFSKIFGDISVIKKNLSELGLMPAMPIAQSCLTQSILYLALCRHRYKETGAKNYSGRIG